MSDKTVAAEVALYKKMYRKILSIVEKINIRARRYQTPLQKMPSAGHSTSSCHYC